MLVNAILLSGYSLGCHSFRHLVGGFLDRLSIAPLRKRVYSVSSACNRKHMNWAWFSLFGVALDRRLHPAVRERESSLT